MRIPSSVFAVGRYALALAAVAGSVVLMSATKKTEFTVHDKAYYADPNTVNFVRPGLVIAIQSATLDANGVISVEYKITDPKGQPLDRDGIMTPGAVSVSFIAAYIPQGATEFWAYTTRPATSPITKVTTSQASADSGGTTTKLADGLYRYTFKAKAVAKSGGAADLSALHRVGAYGSRNLSEFDLGTYYADTFRDFVPNGSSTTQVRDIVATESCNSCHDSLAAHGGSRRSVEVCDMCHTAQSIDPDTGNSVAMDVMVHKLHAGQQLPSVQAGTPYQIIGHNQSVADYSTVAFPSVGGVLACTTCHNPESGAKQANNYLSHPTRQACGSCHDNVNFATGQNHVSLPQVSDNQCSTCHTAQGELEFDASIKGAHTIPQQSAELPGVNIKILNVENASAGQAPLVTYKITNNAGQGYTMAQMTGGFNRVALVLAGPTTDYGYTKFSDAQTTNGYVSPADVVKNSQCAPDGTCTYQFAAKIPADAKGTFAVGAEARRGDTIMANTEKQQEVEYGAKNDVYYFSVDGSPIQQRRQVVSLDKCNSCHVRLSLHGENRNQIEQCVLCHNASETDLGRRASAKDPADKAAPAQGINFAYMVHRIHTGEAMAEKGLSYTVVGFGGSHNDFGEVRYPVLTASGQVGDVAKCYMCHVNGSEAKLPVGKLNVTNPSSPLSPAGATTSACSSCHESNAMFAHALTNTNSQFGESCNVCHGGSAEFNTTKVHAGN